MDLPEIERLITEAVNNRPTVTKAPVNLYIHNGHVICGARAVMPENAAFVSHISPDKLENGFDTNDWKLIVEKTAQVIKEASANAVTGGRTNFSDRRREPRLNLRRPIWFGQNKKRALSRGRMVDIASGGIAFTCYCDDTSPQQGQDIITHFSAPCFGPGESVKLHKFTRGGHICRVDHINSFLKRVAVQFAQNLPFKPTDQNSTISFATDTIEPASIR